MGFKVYDMDGNDVTDNHQWFVDTEGELYMFDGFLRNVGDNYWYSPN